MLLGKKKVTDVLLGPLTFGHRSVLPLPWHHKHLNYWTWKYPTTHMLWKCRGFPLDKN